MPTSKGSNKGSSGGLQAREQQNHMQATADKSKGVLENIEKEFLELKKVLGELNKNVATLRNVEVLQLAGDYTSRKETLAETKKGLKADRSTSRHAVESNARSEAGLRAIRTVIIDLHNTVAGASDFERKERHRIASKEQNESIKKHRTIGWNQMQTLQDFGISSVSGLDRNKKYKSKKTGAEFTRKQILELWDKIPHEKGSERDQSSISRAFNDQNDPRNRQLNVDLTKYLKVIATRDNPGLSSDDVDLLVSDRRDNMSPEKKAKQLLEFNRDNHVEIVSQNKELLIGSSSSNAVMEKILGINTDILNLLKGNVLSDKENAREKRNTVTSGSGKYRHLGRKGRFGLRDKVKPRDSDGNMLGWVGGLYAAKVVGTPVVKKVVKETKKVIDKRKANKIVNQNQKAQQKINKKVNAKANTLQAQTDVKKNTTRTRGVKKPVTVTKVTKSTSWTRNKIKQFVKGLKPGNLALLKNIVKFRDLGKLKALFLAGGPIGIAIMGVMWYVEAQAFDYLDEILMEVDKEQAAKITLPKGINDGLKAQILIEDEGGQFIPLITSSHNKNQLNALTNATTLQKTAIQPSTDGTGTAGGAGAAVVNSGNTSNSGNSVTVHNYGIDYTAGYMNSEKAFNDPLIYPKPLAPGY